MTRKEKKELTKQNIEKAINECIATVLNNTDKMLAENIPANEALRNAFNSIIMDLEKQANQKPQDKHLYHRIGLGFAEKFNAMLEEAQGKIKASRRKNRK